MKNVLIITHLLFYFLITSFAQQKPCSCCTPAHKQFDFWLGKWDVYNVKGIKVGENIILSMQDSCLIQENWSSSGQTGTSYNFYNNADSTWNQIYVDNLGTVLQLKGTFKNNKMVLKSDKVKSVKANFYYFNQITWFKDELGNVSQKWDIVDDKDKILQTVFDGIYKRKP